MLISRTATDRYTKIAPKASSSDSMRAVHRASCIEREREKERARFFLLLFLLRFRVYLISRPSVTQ